ncbi:MAG: PBP1A family penicillin-binding protein [Syntrophomonadaceae bacterium]|nr:PBP1A family penicillin-binding protein [Syntrophomonadaceae bacterium]
MVLQKKQKRKLRLGRFILLVLLISALVLMGAGAGVMAGVLRNLPSFDFENVVPLMTTFIYDQDGNVIDELHGKENRIPVSFDVIPDHLKEAFLATEDRDFYNHFGFDIRGIARAVVVNISAGEVRQGASTITQQLARTAILKRDERRIERKLQELVVAIQLERLFTKDEIFEQYLNWVYFGEGAYGVQAAARVFYGKDVQDLTLSESASLAGMVRAPGGRYSPFRNLENATARRNLVLSLMVEAGYINQEEAKKAQAEPFELADRNQDRLNHNYPYFTDYVSIEAARLLEENGFNPQELFSSGLKVYTTMDARIQAKMQEIYNNPSFFPQGPRGSKRTLESAMVVIDHRTGGIKGMIGGREYNVQKGFNRATQADRQPGSAIKPLTVYAPAFEKGYTPATVIDDSPVTYETPGSPPWSPRNYDERWRGLITVREAVKDSVNIPAVRLLEMIGVNEGLQFGRKLGLPLDPQRDRNLSSIALGGLTRGVSPLSMASAYGAFANQGVLITPHAITKITDRHDNILVSVKPQRELVMSEQTAYLMTDVLQTVVDAGTGRQAKLDRPVAGKTGTTQLSDQLAAQGLRGTSNAWFVAYTPELVGAVYVGYDRTDATHYLPPNVAGGGHPARIWRAVMAEALKGVPVTPFIRPKGLLYSSVDTKSGLLPSELTPSRFIIQELFAKDTVPTEFSAVWHEKQICAETGLLPSPYCPNLIMKVFLQRPPWEGEAAPEDQALTAPTEICTVHRPWNPPVYSPVDKPAGSNMTLYPPPAPKLQATARFTADAGWTVNLSWQVSTTEELSYSVERWEEGNNTRYNLILTNAKSYIDRVEPNKTYFYRVFSVNPKVNLSTPSNEVIIRTVP